MELLKMEHIEKAFFGVTVLNDVSFHVETGRVHALLGENGAGKSTLMNILGGVYTRDAGTVTFNGIELPNGSISAAEKSGIAFVHQELNVVNDLRVYENIFLGQEIASRTGRLLKKEMIRATEKLFSDMGVHGINPLAWAGSLDTGKKQILEIAKALYSEAKLIILDEPTTALSNDEIAHLFTLVRGLKEKGTSFIFISHKMPEIFEIADEFTVLRNSRFIGTGEIKDTTPEDIARMMVGEHYVDASMYERRELGDCIFELKNLTGPGFANINLSARKGEIIGLTGLQGSGTSEMLQSIFGVEPVDGGSIVIEGAELHTGSIHRSMKAGIAMVAANRKENSVIPDLNILENTYVSRHTIDGVSVVAPIRTGAEKDRYLNYKELLNIKAQNPTDMLTSLSGGNQQKVILARWLSTDAKVLLFDNPTQGIDVGAKAEIYHLILELAKEGKTILVNTLEIPEIQKIADRCLVFYHGNAVVDLPHDEISEETVMMYATGISSRPE